MTTVKPQGLSAAILLAGLASLALAETKAPDQDAVWKKRFEKRTLVTRKAEYVHVLWDALGARSEIEAGRKAFLACAAAALVRTVPVPAGAPDLFKVDVVYVASRDRYGDPKWDSLERVAHAEARRSRVVGAGAPGGPCEGLLEKLEVLR